MKEQELVDLVDSRGTVCRRRVTRLEVRDRFEELTSAGLYQPIVVVVVFDDLGRVVAQLRGLAKEDDDALRIDHLTGVMTSGETWQDTASREAGEELGVALRGITHVASGVNVYHRYRTLATAVSDGAPSIQDPEEVAEIIVATPEVLTAMRDQGTRQFVKGFFEDLSSVRAFLSSDTNE